MARTTELERLDIGRWGDHTIDPGERRDIDLLVSESYSGLSVTIPVHIWRAPEPGPAVFITAAVHGDEINGAGAIRQIILEPPFQLTAGALILAPVINILGFDQHIRYLPDRRDLNRCFPGSPTGSMAARLASVVFRQIVGRSDYGIDLHTAAVRRTNFPNVRADMSRDDVAALARAFGSELIVSGKGPKGALRQAACAAGVPTIILEAGEVWKVEPAVVEYALQGVRNTLIGLGMAPGKPVKPAYQTVVDRTRWIRADRGGFLHFHVAPGDLVEQDQPIATNTSLLGAEQNVLTRPHTGVVLGMTTLPSVAPGDPVCHIAIPREGTDAIRKAHRRVKDDSLHERLRDDLATNIVVTEWEGDGEEASERVSE
ncbi:MAG: succinylglutamate desuccinylase/aspartoacylase family protein [Phycisphaerales bacterium JB039]